MPQVYRANLTAAEFPFLSELQGRTVIIGNIDQNFSRQGNSPKNKDRDIGIPQAYYMHNMMPTDAGLTSVGYQQVADSPLDTDNTFGDIFTLRDPTEQVAYLNNTSSGRNYILLNLGLGWIRTTDKTPAAPGLVTTAHVNGQTYICFSKLGIFKYNFGTNVLDPVVTAGLNQANVIGICASNGYMIAWTSTTVVWSSTIDPTDFVPSLITGAGGGAVQDIKAEITVALPNNGGITVYTKKNAVSATYTGNVRYPFSYKEIIGAGGLANPSQSAYDGNSTNHVSYTTAGVQEISINNSAPLFPQLTDFLAGAQFEDYDDATGNFTVLDLIAPMKKKLTQIGNRYIVFSYGVSQLTHAVVYDTALARWGKLKLNHVDCFEYFYPSADVVDAPKRNIGFVQADGKVIVCIISYSNTGSNGTLMLGKYQLDRPSFLQLQEIHLESVQMQNTPSVKVLSTLDGTNAIQTTVPYLAENVGNYRRYNLRANGLNHSLILNGAFHLNSMVLQFDDDGGVR